jgi:sec-independent protein translocase protein TatA
MGALRLGPVELIIILAIVLVLFGGRLTRIGGDLGGSIREFRKGLKGNEEDKEPPKDQQPPESGNPS